MSKKLPVFEDYKAPWEVDSSGNAIPEDEQQLDPALLKKKLYDVLTDRQRLVGERDTIQTELSQVKTDLDAARRKDEGADEKAKREAQEALDAAKAEGGLEALKLDVALDIEGITPKQAKRLAKRLTGKTREELVEDANGLVEDFGLGGKTDNGTSDEDEGQAPEATTASRPQRLRAGGDPAPNAAALPAATADKVDELFPRR